MDLQSRFKDFIKDKNLPLPGRRLLIATSGGLDSIALCQLCHSLGFSFSIAHCNFRLRGDESDADETFVKDLAVKLGVDCHVKGFDTQGYATDHKIGIQEAARQLRYAWFDELLGKRAGDKPEFEYLLTAHHADDNIETLLMNFFKGTGINGLRAMQPVKGRIIRPLLFAFREEIEEYVKQAGLTWREDSSNLSTKYTRNYFRLEIIPAIEKVFPQVRSNLIDNIRRFNEAGELYDHAMEALIKKLPVKKDKEIHIPALRLAKMPGVRALIYEITKPFGFTPAQTEEIFSLLKSGTGKFIDSSTHRILKNRNWLVITPLKTEGSKNIIIEKPEGKIRFDDRTMNISLESLPGKINPNAGEALLDASEIEFPLLLRKWKQGDYFYPLGMRKKKKLSRFFIDQKLSLNEKEEVWVIESGGRIVWVVGHRIDDRFKILPSTTRVIHIACQ